MRLLRALGLLALITGAAAVKISCSAGLHVQGDIGDTHATFAAAATVGFAAMDEIPIAGGELRLAAPHVLEFEGERREMIGFPLKHTSITAKVGGMMSVYTIEQVFENPFEEPIEAVYAFPLGAHGAVSGYEIAIGDRTVHGEIHTTGDARAIYDDARTKGHTAGIVEQVKPNLFTQRVTNIAPGEQVTVKMTFVEMLEYRDGQYEMVMPLTIGPRYRPAIDVAYVGPAHSSSDISFEADIEPGMPIAAVSSPSHQLASRELGPTKMHVSLAREGEIPNKDLIVRYTTAGAQTQVGMLAHRADQTGYFVLTVQPKGAYQTGDISGREVMIVIDRSGSMSGPPIAQAKAIASGIIDTLSERDRFDIIAFASGVETMTPAPVSGNAGGKALGMEYLTRLAAGGGTEMAGGVHAMLTTQPTEHRIRVVYFITDGMIGNDDEVVGAASQLLGTNRIFTIGVGSAPNRSLLDRLATAGRGYASYLAPADDAKPLTTALVARSAYPYLTDISIDWKGLDADVDAMTPTMLPDVYAGQPLVIAGRYGKPGAGTIVVNATAAGGRRVAIPLTVALPERADFEPVASLWARRQIEILEERGDQNGIEALGLRFHLVTARTAFVAVDRTRVVSNGVVRLVEQPAVIPANMDAEHERVAEYDSSSSSSSSYDPPSFSGGGWGGGGPDDDHDLAVLVIVMLVGSLGAGTWLIARKS